jgi:inner membrane protein
VDTLTHALSGAVLGRVFARPGGAGSASLRIAPAMLAGAAAAAFPDSDFVLGYVSEIAYLRGHRGVTHSVLLAPLWALLLAWLMARISRAGRDGVGAAWRAFYPVALGGLLIHIAGDWITQFGTMMLAPFSDRRFGLGAVFIIDLVFSCILIAGLLASALWRRSRVPAVLALFAVAGWVGVCWMGRSEAIAAGEAYAKTQGVSPLLIDAAPRPASPFNWTVIVFDGSDYHLAHLNTRRTRPLVAGADDHFIRRYSAPYLPVAQAAWERRARFGDGKAGMLARRVWEAEDFAFYRWFAMFPVFDRIDAVSAAGPACVTFRDLRFEMPGRAELPFRYGLCGVDDGPWRLYRLAGNTRHWLDGGGALAAE